MICNLVIELYEILYLNDDYDDFSETDENVKPYYLHMSMRRNDASCAKAAFELGIEYDCVPTRVPLTEEYKIRNKIRVTLNRIIVNLHDSKSYYQDSATALGSSREFLKYVYQEINNVLDCKVYPDHKKCSFCNPSFLYEDTDENTNSIDSSLRADMLENFLKFAVHNTGKKNWDIMNTFCEVTKDMHLDLLDLYCAASAKAIDAGVDFIAPEILGMKKANLLYTPYLSSTFYMAVEGDCKLSQLPYQYLMQKETLTGLASDAHLERIRSSFQGLIEMQKSCDEFYMSIKSNSNFLRLPSECLMQKDLLKLYGLDIHLEKVIKSFQDLEDTQQGCAQAILDNSVEYPKEPSDELFFTSKQLKEQMKALHFTDQMALNLSSILYYLPDSQRWKGSEHSNTDVPPKIQCKSNGFDLEKIKIFDTNLSFDLLRQFPDMPDITFSDDNHLSPDYFYHSLDICSETYWNAVLASDNKHKKYITGCLDVFHIGFTAIKMHIIHSLALPLSSYELENTEECKIRLKKIIQGYIKSIVHITYVKITSLLAEFINQAEANSPKTTKLNILPEEFIDICNLKSIFEEISDYSPVPYDLPDIADNVEILENTLEFFAYQADGGFALELNEAIFKPLIDMATAEKKYHIYKKEESEESFNAKKVTELLSAEPFIKELSFQESDALCRESDFFSSFNSEEKLETYLETEANTIRNVQAILNRESGLNQKHYDPELSGMLSSCLVRNAFIHVILNNEYFNNLLTDSIPESIHKLNSDVAVSKFGIMKDIDLRTQKLISFIIDYSLFTLNLNEKKTLFPSSSEYLSDKKTESSEIDSSLSSLLKKVEEKTEMAKRGFAMARIKLAKIKDEISRNKSCCETYAGNLSIEKAGLLTQCRRAVNYTNVSYSFQNSHLSEKLLESLYKSSESNLDNLKFFENMKERFSALLAKSETEIIWSAEEYAELFRFAEIHFPEHYNSNVELERVEKLEILINLIDEKISYNSKELEEKEFIIHSLLLKEESDEIHMPPSKLKSEQLAWKKTSVLANRLKFLLSSINEFAENTLMTEEEFLAMRISQLRSAKDEYYQLLHSSKNTKEGDDNTAITKALDKYVRSRIKLLSNIIVKSESALGLICKNEQILLMLSVVANMKDTQNARCFEYATGEGKSLIAACMSLLFACEGDEVLYLTSKAEDADEFRENYLQKMTKYFLPVSAELSRETGTLQKFGNLTDEQNFRRAQTSTSPKSELPFSYKSVIHCSDTETAVQMLQIEKHISSSRNGQKTDYDDLVIIIDEVDDAVLNQKLSNNPLILKVESEEDKEDVPDEFLEFINFLIRPNKVLLSCAAYDSLVNSEESSDKTELLCKIMNIIIQPSPGNEEIWSHEYFKKNEFLTKKQKIIKSFSFNLTDSEKKDWINRAFSVSRLQSFVDYISHATNSKISIDPLSEKKYRVIEKEINIIRSSTTCTEDDLSEYVYEIQLLLSKHEELRLNDSYSPVSEKKENDDPKKELHVIKVLKPKKSMTVDYTTTHEILRSLKEKIAFSLTGSVGNAKEETSLLNNFDWTEPAITIPRANTCRIYSDSVQIRNTHHDVISEIISNAQKLTEGNSLIIAKDMRDAYSIKSALSKVSFSKNIMIHRVLKSDESAMSLTEINAILTVPESKNNIVITTLGGTRANDYKNIKQVQAYNLPYERYVKQSLGRGGRHGSFAVFKLFFTSDYIKEHCRAISKREIMSSNSYKNNLQLFPEKLPKHLMLIIKEKRFSSLITSLAKEIFLEEKTVNRRKHILLLYFFEILFFLFIHINSLSLFFEKKISGYRRYAEIKRSCIYAVSVFKEKIQEGPEKINANFRDAIKFSARFCNCSSITESCDHDKEFDSNNIHLLGNPFEKKAFAVTEKEVKEFYLQNYGFKADSTDLESKNEEILKLTSHIRKEYSYHLSDNSINCIINHSINFLKNIKKRKSVSLTVHDFKNSVADFKESASSVCSISEATDREVSNSIIERTMAIGILHLSRQLFDCIAESCKTPAFLPRTSDWLRIRFAYSEWMASYFTSEDEISYEEFRDTIFNAFASKHSDSTVEFTDTSALYTNLIMNLDHMINEHILPLTEELRELTSVNSDVLPLNTLNSVHSISGEDQETYMSLS